MDDRRSDCMPRCIDSSTPALTCVDLECQHGRPTCRVLPVNGVSEIRTHDLKVLLILRDSRKSRQKMAKNTADFCENRKNHGKNTASNHGPKHHYTVYKIQHPALSTIITCSARFSSVKFCHCGAF